MSRTGRRARTAARSRTQANAGTTSYYGVGAYLRPLDDARRAEVRFATECLAFANVPRARSALPGGPSVRVHHAAWKARTPRDLGAGWDFDDVRDHYLGGCFGVDPVALRYADHDRYLALGRVVTGEVMAQVVRRMAPRALDVRAAGWSGSCAICGPAPAGASSTRRARPRPPGTTCTAPCSPSRVHVSDEGGNGLALHVVNDGPEPLRRPSSS